MAREHGGTPAGPPARGLPRAPLLLLLLLLLQLVRLEVAHLLPQRLAHLLHLPLELTHARSRAAAVRTARRALVGLRHLELGLERGGARLVRGDHALVLLP